MCAVKSSVRPSPWASTISPDGDALIISPRPPSPSCERRNVGRIVYHCSAYGAKKSPFGTLTIPPRPPSPSCERRDVMFETISISCIHISCASDTYRERCDYAGFILYSHNGQTKWTLNDRRCQSGYLVIQDTASPAVQQQQAREGIVHGKVYKNVFGEDVADDTVGEGFAVRKDGDFAWNSRTFNTRTSAYHDNDRAMSPVVRKCVQKVLSEWIEAGRSERGLGCRNFLIKDL